MASVFPTVRHDNISSVRIYETLPPSPSNLIVSAPPSSARLVLPWINVIILFHGNQQSEPENREKRNKTMNWEKKKQRVLWLFSSSSWIGIASRPFYSTSALESGTCSSMFSGGTSQHCDDIQLWHFTKQFCTWRCHRVRSSPPPSGCHSRRKYSSRSNAAVK